MSDIYDVRLVCLYAINKMSRKEFLKIVRNYLKNKTTVIILHNNSYKDNVDKIYIIEEGQLVEC